MKLSKVLDYAAAAPLKADLAAARGSALAIDASDVERMGALCLQVLLSASRTWREDGNVLTIADPSAPFQDALRLMAAADLAPQGDA